MKLKKSLLAILVSSLGMTTANAETFEVFAQANSATGGSGLNTGLTFSMGDMISGSVASDDLWSAGALPRWSNADGLIADLYATGTDESGYSVGTRIGASFALYNKNGLSAPYGSLVGEIEGNYFLMGTSFEIAAPETGALKLYYWDENNGDNIGSVLATITTPVSEPATLALMIGGLGLVGLMTTRRRKSV